MLCGSGVGRKKSARGQGFWGWHCAILGGGFIAERSFRQADRIRVNDRIRAREIRVVDEDGGQLGVMPPFEAIKLAREKGLDLVEISPTADPPVCKITDYGKYLYQTNKKAHEQRKHQKGSVAQGSQVPPCDRGTRLPGPQEPDHPVSRRRPQGQGDDFSSRARDGSSGSGPRENAPAAGRNRRTRAGRNRPAHGSKCFDGAPGAEARRHGAGETSGRAGRRPGLRSE